MPSNILFFRECCENPKDTELVAGHPYHRKIIEDLRFKGEVNSWINTEKEVPSCFFSIISRLNAYNLVFTNLFMVTQSLLFLRHFRGTKLGKMVMSVVACLKVFGYWAIIAVFVWIPYAFLQHNVRYPNRVLKNYDSKFKLVNGSWELSGERRYR